MCCVGLACLFVLPVYTNAFLKVRWVTDESCKYFSLKPIKNKCFSPSVTIFHGMKINSLTRMLAITWGKCFLQNVIVFHLKKLVNINRLLVKTYVINDTSVK